MSDPRLSSYLNFRGPPSVHQLTVIALLQKKETNRGELTRCSTLSIVSCRHQQFANCEQNLRVPGAGSSLDRNIARDNGTEPLLFNPFCCVGLSFRGLQRITCVSRVSSPPKGVPHWFDSSSYWAHTSKTNLTKRG